MTSEASDATARLERLERDVAALLEQQRRMLEQLAHLEARLAEASSHAPPPDPLADLWRAIEGCTQPRPYNELVGRLLEQNRVVEAERVARRATALWLRSPHAFFNLGAALERQDKFAEAEQAFRATLAIESSFFAARSALSRLLDRQGRSADAVVLLETEAVVSPNDPAVLARLAVYALHAGQHEKAAHFAQRNAQRVYASALWPERGREPPRSFVGSLKAPKLRHDIEQLRYLQSKGILSDELAPIVAEFERTLSEILPVGDVERVAPSVEQRARLGGVYSRILHVRPTPRVDKALSYAWDMPAKEAEYVGNPPGIIVVDRLLSDDALQALRAFCLESTIWTTSRYENGYLGSFFTDGFNCPLLFQIAEELRAAMPRVIGDRHLTTMWAFKYDQQMSGTRLHADEAAVNVNFWLTPDDANLDPDSGGLDVWDAEAPLDWKFEDYNAGSTDLIDKHLAKSNAKSLRFPYRQNRAVIFNSDLFHGTSPFRFKPGYENRRVNVTMLYGGRSDRALEAERRGR
jgi:tetratricopeptide (TPR) repeat protein